MLIRALYDNWPEIFPPPLKNVVSIYGGSPSDDDISRFRKHGLMYVLEMNDGTFHTPLGGGVSSTRTSLVDGMRTDHLRRWANERQRRVLQEMPEIIRRAASDPRGRGFGNIIDLRLVYLRNNTWVLRDENSGYTHPLPSP